MFGMLCGKNVIEQGTFVIIGIFRLGINTKQIFGEFEHVVRIARLGSVVYMHKIDARTFTWKVLAAAVSAKSQRTVLGNGFP